MNDHDLTDPRKTYPEIPASKLEIVTGTAISPAAIVSCPRFNFEATAAADYCPECEHYQGLARMAPKERDRPWHKTYAIRCAYPIERRTVIINAIYKG